VKKFEISRKAQDDFAIESYRRAQAAWKSGAFADEVVEVEVPGKKKGSVSKITEDEGPSRINFEKVPTLKPAFDRSDKGTVTAANASSFNDGASAVVVTNKELAAQVAGSSRVLAKILSTADAATDPIDFTIAPAKAIPIALERAGLSMKDIAVFEINEAFAAVVIANAKILGLESEEDMKKVNPLGGAIALGHAIGSSGSRILVTMLHRLKVGEIGCAAICNGGGAASCMIVQRVDSV
jgi:acetyl-CoA C-acetyltransferase